MKLETESLYDIWYARSMQSICCIIKHGDFKTYTVGFYCLFLLKYNRFDSLRKLNF